MDEQILRPAGPEAGPQLVRPHPCRPWAAGLPAHRAGAGRPGPFLRRTDIGGLNVTIPYKRDVMPYAMRSTRRPGPSAASTPWSAVRTASSAPTTPTRRAFATWPGGRASPFAGRKGRHLWAAVGRLPDAQACARQLGAGGVVVISAPGPDNYETSPATPTRTSW